MTDSAPDNRRKRRIMPWVAFVAIVYLLSPGPVLFCCVQLDFGLPQYTSARVPPTLSERLSGSAYEIIQVVYYPIDVAREEFSIIDDSYNWYEDLFLPEMPDVSTPYRTHGGPI